MKISHAILCKKIDTLVSARCVFTLIELFLLLLYDPCTELLYQTSSFSPSVHVLELRSWWGN